MPFKKNFFLLVVNHHLSIILFAFSLHALLLNLTTNPSIILLKCMYMYVQASYLIHTDE